MKKSATSSFAFFGAHNLPPENEEVGLRLCLHLLNVRGTKTKSCSKIKTMQNRSIFTPTLKKLICSSFLYSGQNHRKQQKLHGFINKKPNRNFRRIFRVPTVLPTVLGFLCLRKNSEKLYPPFPFLNSGSVAIAVAGHVSSQTFEGGRRKGTKFNEDFIAIKDYAFSRVALQPRC